MVRLLPVIVFALAPAVGSAADLPTEVLVLPGGGAGGRDPTATDPVRAALAAGTWTPPKAGDKVAGPRERTWVAAKLKDGTPVAPGAAGGYVYVPVESDRDRVKMLDAAGHAMV